jgi:transcriptional regulator with XRE-family HTH domain
MNRFKELGEERGCSFRGLETQIGSNHNSINRYENETRDPSTATLKQLAGFFEVSIDNMLNHSSCYNYAGYEMKSFTFKIRENYYNIDLNGLLGINGDALGIVLEFERIGRIDA